MWSLSFLGDSGSVSSNKLIAFLFLSQNSQDFHVVLLTGIHKSHSLYSFILFVFFYSTDDVDGLSLSLLALYPIDPTAMFFSSVVSSGCLMH